MASRARLARRFGLDELAVEIVQADARDVLRAAVRRDPILAPALGHLSFRRAG